MPDQARFLDFMDMIDGGGAGRMGDKFEGGGIFSALANLVATPYGSEDPARRARREAAYRAAGLLDTEEDMAAPAAAPAVTRTKPTREELMSARAAEMERQRGLQQDVFDPRGPNQMPAMTAVPSADPYAPLGGSNPAVQAEIARRQEAQRLMAPVADPYAPMGGSNPAVQAEIARRQAAAAEAERMMQFEPLGSGGAAAALQAQAGNAINATGMPPVAGMVPQMVGVPSGMQTTLGVNQSGGSQPMVPMQEFAPQGQFAPTAPSIANMTSPDFAVIDFLEANGIPVTAENVTMYRPTVMAAM